MSSAVSFAFLHGGGQGGWIWDETVAALGLQSRDVRAIAFDLPGCGSKRAQDTSQLTTRDVAASFAEELAQSGLQNIILVGHSNAGTIMPLVAQMQPDLIARYVYVSCVAPPPGQSVREVMASRHEIPKVDAAAAQVPIDRLRKMFCNDMAEDAVPAFLAKLGQDSWPTLTSLNENDWQYDHLAGKPATYVICLQDQALPEPWQETFASRFQVQRRVRIDAGHQVMNTRPHGLAEILHNEASLHL